MKNSLFPFSLKYLKLLGIPLIVGLIFTMNIVVTVSATSTRDQTIINNELSKYTTYIATHPKQFKTQENIDQFYKKIRVVLKSRIDILNGIMNSLPAETGSSLPVIITQPTCGGTTPSGAGVIKSTNLTSFGGGSSSWSFFTNTKGADTDLGVSCTWTCSPGYNRSGNRCILTSTSSATTNPPSQLACIGSAPAGLGIVTTPYSSTSFGGGGTNGTLMVNKESNPNRTGCTWSCGNGYIINESTTGCRLPTENDFFAKRNALLTFPARSEVITNSSWIERLKVLRASIKNTVKIPTNPTPVELKALADYANRSDIKASDWEMATAMNMSIEDFGMMNIRKGMEINTTINYNKSMGFGGSVITIPLTLATTITTSNPTIIWTDSTYSSNYSEYKKSRGDKLYGYILGGDMNNTWSCLAPPTFPNICDTASGFRKLGGTSDAWQWNSTTGRIEFTGGLSVIGYPSGTYIGYVRTGQDGTNTSTSIFTLID